jgi:hypothetical protein
VIDLAAGETLTLKAVAADGLTAAQFGFAATPTPTPVPTPAPTPTPTPTPSGEARSSGPVQAWYLGSAAGTTGDARNGYYDGGGSVERMEGGGGDDSYVVYHPTDIVVEAADAGIDSVSSWSSYVLPDDVENLSLIAGPGADATGSRGSAATTSSPATAARTASCSRPAPGPTTSRISQPASTASTCRASPSPTSPPCRPR